VKLYLAPHACSLSPHIALREADLPFELVRVDLRTKRTADGADYLAVNPKGYVPALQFDDGRVLTEGAVIVQWIADQRPESHLAPPLGTFERLRLHEWLHFIGTEIHARFGPLYGNKTPAHYRALVIDKLTVRLRFLAEAVTQHPFLMGDTFTVADGYAFYTLRNWKRLVAQTLPAAALDDYFTRIRARPSVDAALAVEADFL
jgi:glutathione S-transferase